MLYFLTNLWYLFSIIIGIMMFFVSLLLFIFAPMIIIIGLKEPINMGIKSEIKNHLLFGLFSIVFCSFTIYVNSTVSKYSYIESEEIPNIFAYNGVGNEKSGNSTDEYFYFEQGNKDNYNEYKVPQYKTHSHHTGKQEDIKVVLNHTEYTSPFRYFGIVSLEANEYYDVYIP